MKNKPQEKMHKISRMIMIALGLMTTSSAFAEKLIIQAYAVMLRKRPSLIATSIGEVKYEQEVQKLAQEGDFVKVRAGNLEGWIPKTAVTTPKKLKIKKGNQVELNKADASAAGLGVGVFSESSGGKKPSKATGTKRVDAVEAATPDVEGAVQEFKDSGGLKPGQRGSKSK
jgi:hypothetical protein